MATYYMDADGKIHDKNPKEQRAGVPAGGGKNYVMYEDGTVSLKKEPPAVAPSTGGTSKTSSPYERHSGMIGSIYPAETQKSKSDAQKIAMGTLLSNPDKHAFDNIDKKYGTSDITRAYDAAIKGMEDNEDAKRLQELEFYYTQYSMNPGAWSGDKEMQQWVTEYEELAKKLGVSSSSAYNAQIESLRSQKNKIVTDNFIKADLEELATWPQEDQDLMYQAFDAHSKGEFNVRNENLNSLFTKYGKDNVLRILETVEYSKGKERYEAAFKDGQESGDILNVPISLLANTIGNFGALPYRLAKVIDGGTGRYGAGYVPYSDWEAWGKGVQESTKEEVGYWVREHMEGAGASKGAQDFAESLSEFAFGVGVQSVDNFAKIYTLGAGSLALAAVSGFSEGYQKAADSGLSGDAAMVLGVATGALEVLTEKIPLDELLDSVKAGKSGAQVWGDALRQGGVEATTEELNFLGGLAAEAVILREKSGYNEMVRNAMAQGMTYEQATAYASKQVFLMAAETAAMAWASGSAMSGITSAMTNIDPNNVLAQQAERYANKNNTVNTDMFARYKASKVNSDVLALVDRVKQGASSTNEKVDLGTVADPVAQRIQELTGVDTRGYSIVIEARQIEHILKDHGENGTTDRSMADPEDIARIEYILENPDSIVKSGTTRAYVTNKNGKMKPADTVLYEKQKGDGSYYVVQAVPDTKKKTLYVVTAFMGKSGYKKTEAPQSTNAISPGATPVAESVKASNNSILGNDPIVNTENDSQTAQSGRITVDELMEGIGDKPKTVPTQSRQGADSDINISDLLDETVAKRNGAPADPVAAAVEGFRSTGTVTNKQAQDILNSARAVTQLMKEVDLKIYGLSASQQRTAVKEAVAKLANAEVDTTAGTDYDNSNITGGVNYGAGEQGYGRQNNGGPDQNGAGFYEGIRTEESSRPQIPGGRGEENSGSVGTSVLGESAGITNERFSPEDMYTPEDGTVLRKAQERFAEEYNLPCRIVKASAWKLKSPAAIQNGVVYVEDDIHEANIPSLIPHEANHAMKQKGFSPYIEFVGRTADMLSQGSAQANRLMKMAAEHAGIDLFSMTDHDFGRLFDELNSIVYGFKQGGVLEDSRFDYGQWIPDAFLDFDSYIRELDQLHAQFKQEQKSKGTPAADESVGAAPSGFDPISHLQYEYGTIPEGENAVRDDSLPVSTDGTDRVSRTARTAKGAKVTTEELADLIDKDVVKGGLSYIPITNNATVQKAAKTIQNLGWDDALANWKADVRNGKAGADLVAQGALFLNNAAKAGDKTQWLDILHDYQKLGTNTAQGLQALRILKTLDPDDKLYMIERSVQQMVEDMKLDVEIELDEDLLNEFEQAETDEARDEALDKIKQCVADQIPSTFMDKFTALRYTNMLGNLRTQVRNVAGNAGMKAVSGIKNAIATGLEAIASKASGGKLRRTKSFTVSKEQLSAARADFDTFQDIVSGSGKYQDRAEGTAFQQAVLDRKTVFRGKNIVSKALEGYRKATNWAMEQGDRMFSKPAYARALAGYLKANGITETDYTKIDKGFMDEARLYAAKEAQEQTFRDTNWLSGWVSKIGRRKDTPAVGKLISEGVMPFRKTPANVLVRAEEYSPLGIINSAYYSIKAMQKGSDVTGAQVINSWAKTLTGTGIFALGMLLKNLGVLVGGPDEDEGKEEFEELSGYQNYALQFGDVSYTIDWLTPAAMPLLMGAELWELIQDGGFEGKDMEQALLSIADPMIQMSMLQGIDDTLENISYADSNLGQLAVNAALSYLTQGLTNTALGQVERAFEDSRMTTYVDKESAVSAWLQRTVGKASAKIPGWDYNQVPYINAWGEEEENPQWAAGLAYNMLSPGYYEKGVSDEVYEELMRLDEAQADKNVFPSSPQKSITINKQERNLSAEEWTALAKAQGQTARDIVEDIINSADYRWLTDQQKADAMAYAYDYAREHARVETLDGYDDYSAKWMQGISGHEAEAILRKVATGDVDKFADLPIDKAAMLSEAIQDLFDKPKETKPDGSSYTSVRTIQKVETVAASSLTEKEQQKAMEDILDDKAYEKYLKILDAGYDTDDYAESYRIYVDTEGTKAQIIRELMQEMSLTKRQATTIYEIYVPPKK